MTDFSSNISRRRFGKLALAASSALVTPAIFTRSANAQIKKGDELTVGIWGGAQERITREFIAKPLEEKYGVRINFVLGGTPDRRSRAYAERGRPSFDVIYLNIFESRQAVRDRVTQPASESVPAYEHLYDIARQGGYGVAFNPVTIVYDKTKVEPITSWKDLWRPELRGRIIWPTYPGAQGTAALLMTAKVWGGSETDIDIAFKKIAELKPFPALQGSQDQLFTMFDQKIGDVSIEFGSFTRSYAESRNPNIAIATPEEGQAVAMNVACITEGTPHQKLAEEWVNLHLSEPCQLAYSREIYYSPTVKNITMPDDLREKLIVGEEQVATLVDFDWDVVVKNQSAWTQRFNREITS
ncbi:PotD/PotF family extracellular solute-binding protein [Telmatospirillum sp. J64-1]|uniref:ABC transporter substrate-binding protein n=1 Tax=Telmatospirillum sp. J64-1 TaxID=2502183 RepID=UPI00115F2180|nr:extracellular solute-binding protein [Telmatospirillum sp. J64-1]